MRGGDEDRTAGMSSLTNEEPLVVMKACIDVVWEVIREDCGDGRGSMVRKGEASLCRGRCRYVCEGAFGAEDRDIGCNRGIGGHRGSEVFAAGRGDEDVVGVDGDIFVERREEKSIEDLLSDVGGSGRHCG